MIWTLTKLNLCKLKERSLTGSLITLFYYLIMDCREDSSMLFSEVHNGWTRSDEKKVQQVKSELATS